MKKLFSLLLIVVMMVSMFTGCGSSVPAEPSAATGASAVNAPKEEGKKFEGVTLNYASCFTAAEQHAVWINALAKEWSELTGAEIDINFAGRDVLTAIKSDILIGNAPDLLDQDFSEISGALLSDEEILLEPLNDVFDRPAYGETDNIRDHLNGAYSLYSIDGNDYILPFIYITSGFFYNKTMFKELNIEVPKTWEEFVAVCEAIEASGIPALAADGNISFYNCYYYQNLCARILGNGRFCEAALDPTGASWDDPGFLKAAELVAEINASGKNFFQDGYAGTAYPAGQSDWAMGGAGMVFCGTWIPLETASLVDPDFEYGFFPFPSVDGGEGALTDIEAQLIGFSVPKDAKNKEAAKDFIAYCSSKIAADACVEATDNMSARTDAIYPDALIDVKPTVDSATGYHKNFDGAMAAAPEWWANVFYPADDGLFFGDLTPEEFIEQIKSETIKFYANK